MRLWFRARLSGGSVRLPVPSRVRSFLSIQVNTRQVTRVHESVSTSSARPSKTGALRVLAKHTRCWGAVDDRRAGHLLRHVLLVPAARRLRPLPHVGPLQAQEAPALPATFQFGRGYDIHGGRQSARGGDAVARAHAGVQAAPGTDRRLTPRLLPAVHVRSAVCLRGLVSLEKLPCSRRRAAQPNVARTVAASFKRSALSRLSSMTGIRAT